MFANDNGKRTSARMSFFLCPIEKITICLVFSIFLL